MGDAVAGVHVDQVRLEACGFFLAHAGECRHDDQVTDLHMARGTAIERDDATAFIGTQGVGRKTRTVGHVPDVHLLEFEDAAGIQQQAIDGDGTFVVELGMGDGGAVDLGLQQAELHDRKGLGERLKSSKPMPRCCASRTPT